MEKLSIEVQYFEGCPNSPILIERVKKAIHSIDNIEYKEIIVDTNEKAKEICFRGSPTLIINNVDFESLPKPESSSLSCRVYKNGIPSIEEIKAKISELI